MFRSEKEDTFLRGNIGHKNVEFNTDNFDSRQNDIFVVNLYAATHEKPGSHGLFGIGCPLWDRLTSFLVNLRGDALNCSVNLRCDA